VTVSHLVRPQLIHHVGKLQDPARRIHGHQHVPAVPQRRQDVGHQLFVAQAPLGLDVGGVVGVRDEQTWAWQPVNVAAVEMSLLDGT
jgi:hypothetical protein